MKIGAAGNQTAMKALLLGSGELGKELVIELMRLGVEVVACDRYSDAPAMQVSHRSHVFNMLDGDRLEEIIRKENPHLIIPEVEAIATERLLSLEAEGFCVIPTARATNLSMDREGIRRLAAETLDLPTAQYRFANSFAEFELACKELGLPAVVKPIMSSSGKGQSLVRSEDELAAAWEKSQSGGRTGEGRVIVEEFIDFDSEITLLTVRAKDGTHFCSPIGHRQESGDYVESWQPHPMSAEQLELAQSIAKTVTDELGGFGLYGVELFLHQDGRVIFSELSPRPHDTGMVTLISQNLSEFALHAKAILGLPIYDIRSYGPAASAALKSDIETQHPVITGIDDAYSIKDVELRVFGKPTATVGRRMAVTLARGSTVDKAIETAKKARNCLNVTSEEASPGH